MNVVTDHLEYIFSGVPSQCGAGYLSAVARANSPQLSGAFQRDGLYQNVGETAAIGCMYSLHVTVM